MSLFEDEQYRWRDTYFVLFNEPDQPATEVVLAALTSLGPRYVVKDAPAMNRADSSRSR